MSKKQRQIIFNKFGGRCSYCGCDLTGTRWHIDHAEPVERKYRSIPGGYYHKKTGEPIPNELKRTPSEEEFSKYLTDYQYKGSRLVPNGFRKPENHRIENMMPACASCNINKHSMNIEEFRGFIARFVLSLNKASTQYIVAKRYGLIKETRKPVVFYFETIHTRSRAKNKRR